VCIQHQTIRCARLADGELAVLGKKQRRTTIIYRTVWWYTGLSGEPTVGRVICERRVAHSNGRLGTSDCPVCTGHCPVRQSTPRTNSQMHQKRKEIAHRIATVTVRWCTRLSSAPDCPVHHTTEGKFGLPSWPPMAPSCLGAIKGTPRRIEEHTKPSRNILRLPDFDSTLLILCVSDLSSI
jgi:hypothetical protein